MVQGLQLAANINGKKKISLISPTTGKDTDIQTLLSFLPESIRKNFEKYQSKGDVYFNSKLKGEISSKTKPIIVDRIWLQQHYRFSSRIQIADRTSQRLRILRLE